MSDEIKTERHKPSVFQAIRWPTLDRAVVGGDPMYDIPDPGTEVTIDGQRYVVKDARSIKQFEIIVEQQRL